jgi:steroid delta-isomerase-like uncharacterized protein
MSLQENKDLIRRFVEEVQCQHNLALVDELFSPDYVDHTGIADPPDREGARMAFVRLLEAFPDHRFIVHQQLAEGDKVVTHKTFHGTHLGPWHGMPATGKAVSFELIDIFTIHDGQIAGHWAVVDMLDMMQKIGVMTAS